MQTSSGKFPVLRYSLSGFAALRDNLLFIPVWIVVFVAISLVYTVFFNMVYSYHGGQIVIYIQHYLAFDFSNLSDTNSLDYVFQLKDIFELALPIALAYFTVIPIAVARARLLQERSLFAHIGFGQSELIVAMNTIISYIPPLVFLFLLSLGLHFVANLVAPATVPTHFTPSFDQPAPSDAQVTARNVHFGFRTLSVIVTLPLLIYTYVRTSLALPYSVDQSRLGVLFSWRATQRLFWPLFQIEALALIWALLVCGGVYVLFAAGYKFVFEKVYLISYSAVFTGNMDQSYFFNLIAISIIYILFLNLTLGPLITVYRALQPPAEDSDTVD